MKQDWNIRKYRNGDREGILELLNFGGEGWQKNATVELWSWFYQLNPFGNFIGVADYEGKIIGHMALIPTLMKIGEETKLCSQAVALIVHPDFRRRGLFVTLGRYITDEAGTEGIDICYGFPNKPAHLGHLKYGWFDICDVPKYRRFVSPRAFGGFRRIEEALGSRGQKITQFLTFAGRILLQSFYLYPKLLYRTRTASEKIEVQEISSFDKSEFNELWKEAAKNFQISVVRNAKYLNWRYRHRPNTDYHVLVAKKDGKMRGYSIVLTKEKSGVKEGYIVDLFSVPDICVVQNLISHSINHLETLNVDRISCWLLGSRMIHKVLKNKAFILCGRTPLIARINGEKTTITEEFLRNPMNWYITMGDSDFA